MITEEEIKKLLSYDPDTGVFTWNVRRGGTAREGSVAGSVNSKGYVLIGMGNKSYQSHRLAFLLMTGKMPIAEVDHVNGCPSDNRWANLRHATRAENNRNQDIRSNNSSGIKGVSWQKASGKWHARTNINGKQQHIGYFINIEDAKEAVRAAREVLHGEFTNHGDHA